MHRWYKSQPWQQAVVYFFKPVYFLAQTTRNFAIFWLFCREFTHSLAYFLQAVVYQNWQISGMNLWWVWSWEYDEPFSSGLGRINGRSGKTTSVGVCLSTWLLTLFDAWGGGGEKRNGIWISWCFERFFWHSSEVSWRRSKRMKWKGIRVEILHNF